MVERFLLRQLQREVERQCRFATLALEDLDEAVSSGQGLRFWFSIQNFLVAVGSISRLLWPDDEDASPCGRELRESLDVPPDSPLKSRRFVEYFEQFEERLAGWHHASESHRFFDSYTEPLDVLGATKPGDRFRGYDTENDAILFHGEMYHLQPISDAIDELLENTERETRKPRFSEPEG